MEDRLRQLAPRPRHAAREHQPKPTMPLRRLPPTGTACVAGCTGVHCVRHFGGRHAARPRPEARARPARREPRPAAPRAPRRAGARLLRSDAAAAARGEDRRGRGSEAPGPGRRDPRSHLPARGKGAVPRARLLPRRRLGDRQHRDARRLVSRPREPHRLRRRLGGLPARARGPLSRRGRGLLCRDEVGRREREGARRGRRIASGSAATARAGTSPPRSP